VKDSPSASTVDTAFERSWILSVGTQHHFVSPFDKAYQSGAGLIKSSVAIGLPKTGGRVCLRIDYESDSFFAYFLSHR